MVLTLNLHQTSEIGRIMDSRISLKVELRADGNFVRNRVYGYGILSLGLTSKLRRKWLSNPSRVKGMRGVAFCRFNGNGTTGIALLSYFVSRYGTALLFEKAQRVRFPHMNPNARVGPDAGRKAV